MQGVLPESNKKNTIIGLWLLYLLSSNKISEFHSELESLSAQDLADPHIQVPIEIEMHFVDGNYSMVLQTKSKVQREEYSYFINKFVESVRKELAKSVEISY